MGLNEFILHRFNGDEVFRLGSTTILAYRTEDGIRINLDAETDGAALKTLPDTAQYPANPRAEVAFVVESLDVTRLVGQRFVVPHARTRDDDLASMYYYEHEELNENVVAFLDHKADWFRLRWTAITKDVNFYDGSKPETNVEIEGWFQFEEFEKWIGK